MMLNGLQTAIRTLTTLDNSGGADDGRGGEYALLESELADLRAGLLRALDDAVTHEASIVPLGQFSPPRHAESPVHRCSAQLGTRKVAMGSYLSGLFRRLFWCEARLRWQQEQDLAEEAAEEKPGNIVARQQSIASGSTAASSGGSVVRETRSGDSCFS
jgi:hypothetical protein